MEAFDLQTVGATEMQHPGSPEVSGARTPDFVAAWRAEEGGAGEDTRKEASLASTPRDTGGTGAMKAMAAELLSKLQGLKAPSRILPVGFVLQEPRLLPVGLVPPEGAPAATAVPRPAMLAVPAAEPRRVEAAAGGPHSPPDEELAPTGPAAVPPPPPPPPIISLGTVGHPTKCAEPCTEEPCSRGSMCHRCHLCGRRERLAKEAKKKADEAPGECPSVGSLGHPDSCAEACKFYAKSKGCKDGTLCVRCHLCKWNRYARPAARKRGTKALAALCSAAPLGPD